MYIVFKNEQSQSMILIHLNSLGEEGTKEARLFESPCVIKGSLSTLNYEHNLFLVFLFFAPGTHHQSVSAFAQGEIQVMGDRGGQDSALLIFSNVINQSGTLYYAIFLFFFQPPSYLGFLCPASFIVVCHLIFRQLAANGL